MSTTYTDLTETNFPDAVDTLTRMSDLDSSRKTLADQYYTYINAGNFTAAATLLTDNPILETMILNAAKINKFLDGVIAVQRYFKLELQDYLNEQLTYVGEYSTGTTYIKTNVVSYNGEGFICRVDSSVGTAPVAHTTTTNWAIISQQGIQGVSGTGLAPRGVWVAATQYYTNDCVANDNALWQALENNINSEPAAGNSKWVVLIDFIDSADQTVTFTEASTRVNIASGESHSTLFGKIKKWFSSLGTAAFLGIGTTAQTISSSNSAGSSSTLSRSDHSHALPTVTTTPVTSTAVPSDGQGFTCIGDITTDGYGRVVEKNTKTITLPTMLTKLLTGLSTSTNSTISSTDSILSAFGKLQTQINLSTPLITYDSNSIVAKFPSGLMIQCKLVEFTGQNIAVAMTEDLYQSGSIDMGDYSNSFTSIFYTSYSKDSGTNPTPWWCTGKRTTTPLVNWPTLTLISPVSYTSSTGITRVSGLAIGLWK